jgi:hypothetical protein
MACSFPNLHYRGPALAAPIFQQNYGPKTWSAKPEFFFLVEHPPAPISTVPTTAGQCKQKNSAPQKIKEYVLAAKKKNSI